MFQTAEKIFGGKYVIVGVILEIFLLLQKRKHYKDLACLLRYWLVY